MKKLVLLAAASLIASGGFAATLTPEQALQRARASASAGRHLVKPTVQASLVYTSKGNDGEALVYVFNQGSSEGIMVLSADDVAMPLLGYTDAGSFDPNNIPTDMKYWIEEYGRQIAYAKAQGAVPQQKDVTMSFPSSWTDITPLLTTNWDQGAPYNLSTPVRNGFQCPTGCVATAVAQVMNYWEYPSQGEGQVSYSCQGLGTLTMTFDRQDPFDWKNMLDNYVTGQYNTTQADAVSNLMRQVGYAVQMQYGPYASGTQTELVGPALMKYFNYNTGITMEQRLGYNASDWNNLVYSQLKDVGPVIYAGASTSGAHCFVIDGYDGQGYFHVNWGWGGICNGYYLLNALNPTQQGTGGYYGGYNFTQGILAGVKPSDSAPATNTPLTMSLNASVQATMASSVMTFTFSGDREPRMGNDCMYSIKPVLGIEISKEDGSGTPIYVSASSPASFPVFAPGTYTSISNLQMRARFDSSLENGRYKVRVVCKDEGNNGDGQWHPLLMAPQNYDYVIVTKSGNSYEVQNFKPDRYNITKAEITTPLYYNNPCLIELTLENPYNKEITQSIIPYLKKDGSQQYEGESRLITMMPNEKTTISIPCTFERIQGGTVPSTSAPVDFSLVLNDYNYGEDYGEYGTYTMRRASTNRAVRLRSFVITNAAEDIRDEKIGFIYGLNNFSNIHLSVTFDVTGGFIATPLTASIYEYDPESREYLAMVYEKDFENMVYLGAGDAATETTTLHFTNFDVNKIYAINILYIDNGIRKSLGSLRFAASSGVYGPAAEAQDIVISMNGNILNAESAAGVAFVEVYDAKGSKVAAANNGQLDLSYLSAGMYIVRAMDNAGNLETVKILK